MQAFFKYDTQPTSTTHNQQAASTTYIPHVSDVATNVSDSSFLLSGPAPTGSSHGSYLASPVPKRYSLFAFFYSLRFGDVRLISYFVSRFAVPARISLNLAGTTRHDTTRHGTTRHDTARHGTARTVGLCRTIRKRPLVWVDTVRILLECVAWPGT